MTETVADLTTYDYIVLNSSAGKDSQAMIDFVVECADHDGIPRERLIVVHADLGRVEWAGTPELAKEQADHYGLRFEIVQRKGRVFRGNELGDLLDHIEQRKRWPDSQNRYCTSDHKRGQIGRLTTQLGREVLDLEMQRAEATARAAGITTKTGILNARQAAKRAKHVRILQCLGMRAEESPARAKLVDFKIEERSSHPGRTVHTWLPIHDWTANQVWARIRRSGVPHHPAYDYGMPRLSCCFCVFAPRNALMLAGKHNPELLDEYVRVERAIGHTFRHRFTIESVRDAIEAGEADNLTPDDLGTGSWNM